jgi:carboxyl-terminal processing protease
MRPLVSFCCAIILLCLGAAPGNAGKRVALVIGNDRYAELPALHNAVSDARAVAEALKELQFRVFKGENLDYRGANRLHADFETALAPGDTAFVFFAGHGVALAGENYLLPTDMEKPKPGEDNLVRSEAHSIDSLIRRVQAKGTLASFYVIDACRDNPFEQTGVRSIGTARGLARTDAPTGVFVLYSAGIGQTALDRLNDADRAPNSVFTRTLIPLLNQPGLTHLALAKRVQTEVKALASSVGHQQQPAFYDQIDGEVILSKARAEGVVAALKPLETPTRPPESKPAGPKLTRSEVITLFARLGEVIERVRSDYVDRPDERALILAATESMLRAVPSSKKYSMLGTVHELQSSSVAAGLGVKIDLNYFYDAALEVLNDRRSGDDDADIVNATINGMLASLDAHSSYMDPRSFAELLTKPRGDGAGIGAELTLKDGLPQIVSPTDDGPAARAGLRAGDIIASFDDEPTDGLTLGQVRAKSRGPVGSRLRIKAFRKGRDQPIDVEIVREMPTTAALRAQAIGDVAYVRFPAFNEQTTESLKKAIADLQAGIGENRLKGYVIDLRNNPGGLLDQAISVADAFLERGDIVSTRGRIAEESQRFVARTGDLAKGKPIIVLINGGSASASEIVAAALRENGRATLVGTRSFGQGLVATVMPLGAGNGALRLTTSRFLTPSGRIIHGKGIQPDIEVLQDVPDEVRKPTEAGAGGGSQSYVPPDAKDDKALQAALALLRGTQVNPAFPTRR